MNPIADKIAKLKARIEWGREMGFYFYLQPVKDIDGARILAGTALEALDALESAGEPGRP